MTKKQLYLHLFIDTIYTATLAFGGGMVVLGMIRRLYVKKYGCLTDDELTDLIALAQSAPGAISANTFMMVGYNLAGFGGAVITMIANIIPPLIIITLLSFFYNYIRDNIVAEYILKAMRAGVGAVIISICTDMIINVTKKGNRIFSVLLLTAAFIASYIIKFPAVYIIILSAASGVIFYYINFKISLKKSGDNKK